MVSKLKTVLPIIVFAALALVGCRGTVPIENVSNAPYGLASYTADEPLTLEDYEQAIVRAGSKRNWVFERVGPGHLVATNVVRGKHTAVVDITFDTESFSIDYKDSRNLKYDPSTQTIHPNYNAWVDLLKVDIQTEIQILDAQELG
jgi:hypothetical protein